MELEVGPKVLKVVVVWQFVGNLGVEGNRRFVCPASSYVTDGVASTFKRRFEIN